jgi:pantoate--beta-alanine ligase
MILSETPVARSGRAAVLEVEVKFAVADFAPVEAALKAKDIAIGPARRDTDHYFNAPDRDFAVTDEAVRVRTTGERNFVTYKGPKVDRTTKTRLEIEVPLADGETAANDFRRLLTHLGYRPVAVVNKTRRVADFTRDGFDMEVTLDEVDSVGRYAELEVIAPEHMADAAKAAVLAASAEFGLTQSERRSYLQLLLEKRGGAMTPLLTHTIADARRVVAGARGRGLTIGFVATMGALHEGHASLIRLAREQCGFVAVSIFVNPTQFGPNEDFTRYPRTLDADLAVCEANGVDLVFAPEPTTMYPPGSRTFVEVRELGNHLCGPSRPGHFRGVATVVLKLLNIVQPDRAYFGQKDAQQARIICQLVRDLDVPTEIILGPTVREPDGLALSSRNRYLNATERQDATVLIETLREVRRRVEAGERDAAALRSYMADHFRATPGANLDYAEIVDADSFTPVDRLAGPAVAAVAVRFGSTRLIDNIDLSP